MALLAVALVLAAAPTPAPPPAWSTLDSAQRTRAIVELKASPWPGRLAAAAGRFLGTPYVVSPLGEGEGPDADPLVRFDAVDCLTMVEQSLALALAADDAAVVPVLNRVRYSGPPSYGHRNHVMEAQWLPRQLEEGWLRDVTRAYGGPATVQVKKVITAATWEGALGRSLELDASARATGEFELDVIPAPAAAKALAQAPSGLVVVVVRADAPSKVTRISHVGVLVHRASGPVLRHASSLRRRVVDEPLAHFLEQNRAARWALEGLAVYEPLAPASADGGSAALLW